MIIGINFGTEGSASGEGFVLDDGQGYSENRGYGWVEQSSLEGEVVPLDLTSNTRDRNLNSDPNSDTLIHLQYPANFTGIGSNPPVKIPGAWEYDLENGTYQVTVGVGDPEFIDSNHVVNIEGQSVISGFAPSEAAPFGEASTTIEVTDGRLTIDALGGTNTKLNFVEIDTVDGVQGGTTPEDSADEGDDSDDSAAEDSTDADNDNSAIPEDSADEGDDSDDNAAEDSTDEVDEVASGTTPEDSADESDDSDDSSAAEDSTDADNDNSATPEDSADEGGGSDDDVAEDLNESGDLVDENTDNSDDSDISEDVVRFNFGPPDASSGNEFVQDIGTEFSEAQGYGWVTQDSAGSNSPIPLDLQGNARDRNSIEQSELDSFIHLQYSEDFTLPRSTTTPAAWEYEIANGEYAVTVAVGDAEFTDSNHVINIEGESAISGFTPTNDELFEISTSVVEVTDGKLTIDAISGENTKLNYVEIAPANDSALTDTPNDDPANITPIETPDEVGIPVEGGGVVQPVQARDGGINVNFGTPSADSASGFVQDIGEAYDPGTGYGWVTQATLGDASPVPIDVIANGRDRDTLFSDEQGGTFQEPVRDSLIHMQYPTGLANSVISVTTPAAWEYDLANGTYEVTVGVGDPDFFDSTHVINVEGETLISGFTPTGFEVNGFLPLGAQSFTEGSAIVEVEDGRLTLDALGGENTKINYVSIVPVDTV